MRAPALGVGAVYWSPLHALFAGHPDIVQVAEVEPSTFWLKSPGRAGAVRSNPLALDRIAALPQAKLVHGVGYPVGGTICDAAVHLDEQRRWAERLGAPWTSEHLSFNETAGGNAGFLLPPCQSDDGVALAAANIRGRAAALGSRFAFETGVNYLPPQPGEMPDGAFFAAVAQAADCDILLDLHNLWTNERNGRARVRDVIAALPLERVCELHLAGGMERDGYWLDAHSGAVPPALLDLAADVVAELPALGAILFEISPEFLPVLGETGVLRQVEALHPLWERRGRTASARAAHAPSAEPGMRAADWEDMLGRGLRGDDPAPALALYRMLIEAFRKGAIADTLPHSIRLLQITHGEDAVDRLLAGYARATEPQLFPGDEATGCAEWLGRNAPATPYLDDVLALEAGIVRIATAGEAGEIALAHDPSLLVGAIAQGRPPAGLPRGDYRLRLG